MKVLIAIDSSPASQRVLEEVLNALGLRIALSASSAKRSLPPGPAN